MPFECPSNIQVLDFRSAWEKLGSEAEVLEKFGLSQFAQIAEACPKVIEFLAMQPCEGTGSVPTRGNGAKQHMLLLSGVMGQCQVLARAQFSMDAAQSRGVILKVRGV